MKSLLLSHFCKVFLIKIYNKQEAIVITIIICDMERGYHHPCDCLTFSFLCWHGLDKDHHYDVFIFVFLWNWA